MEEQGTDFQVEQIDHVEVFVPDRYQAASWYREILGLKVLADFEMWAHDPQGPLMISSDAGHTKLALFEGPAQKSQEVTGLILVAFRVSAAGFIHFLERLPDLDLVDHQGRRVTPRLVKDHARAFSIYFCDPYGNQLEITTYDHSAVRTYMEASNAS